jgi:CarD family transcriptional regulator
MKAAASARGSGTKRAKQARPAAGRPASRAAASRKKPAAKAMVAAVATKTAPAAAKKVQARPAPEKLARPRVEAVRAVTASAGEPSGKAEVRQVPATKPEVQAAKPLVRPAAKPAVAPKLTVRPAAMDPGPRITEPARPAAQAQQSGTPGGASGSDVAARPARQQEPERRSGPPVFQPRQPAKPEIFAEGDHVVYPTHGVGKVERIATEEIAGHKLELIHITFEENRMTLRVPVAKARSAGLRKLATRELFDKAMKVLEGRARVKRTMWSRRAQEYEAKINSGDPLAIAEVVRDLHRNAGQPDQSFSERQIYEAAMDRLAAELAALDRTDKVTAATKLADFLKTV